MLSRSESTFQTSICGFRSVLPSLARHVSWVQIQFFFFLKKNRPCRINMIRNLFRSCDRFQPVLESSNQVCVASCNLHLGVILIFLHCRYHTLIWVVEPYCVVFAFHTVPHSPFEVQRCVRHTLWSDVNELPQWSGNMVCWCRSISTSMTFLCSTNSPTSSLSQAPCLLSLQTGLLQNVCVGLVDSTVV